MGYCYLGHRFSFYIFEFLNVIHKIPLRDVVNSRVKLYKPFPMCLRVFSIVEFLLTFDRSPKQKRSALFDGSVNPSTTMLVCDA